MHSSSFTFDWKTHRWFCPRLAATLGISIFAHLLVALLFTVETTEKVTSPPPSDEISILSRDIPEHRALLDFLQSESPIGALAHQLLPVGDTPKTHYHFSFAHSQLVPLPPPRWTLPQTTPLPQVPILTPDNTENPATPNNPLTSRASRFEGNLHCTASLQSRLQSPLRIPSSPTLQLLEPVTFLIGIRAQGSVAYVMLQKTSGDSNADSHAENFLRQLTFQKSDSPLEWGSATLEWASPVLP